VRKIKSLKKGITRRKLNIFGISFILLFAFVATTHTITTSIAAKPMFHEIFTSDPSFSRIFFSYEVFVWSNGHVEVFATYCYYDDNPDKCAFLYLGVQTTIYYTLDNNWNVNIPQHAPNNPQEAYVDDLNPNADQWQNGWLMNIAIQMKFNSFDYITAHYATIQMCLQYRPTGAIGFLSSDYIVISGHPVMNDPP